MYENFRKLSVDDDGVWGVAMTGTSVVAAVNDSLRWISVESGQVEKSLTVHTAPIVSLSMDRRYQTLLTSSLDGHVKLLGTDSGDVQRDIAAGAAEAWQTTFGLDDKGESAFVLAACQSRTADVRVWQTESGEAMSSYGSGGEINVSVSASRDGRLVAVGSMSGRVSLFNASSGSKLHSFQAHKGAVRALEFAHDSATLLTGGADGHVQVHDAESGSPIVALAGHSGAVHVLAHSPDRKRFATAGADRSVRIWETGSAEPVHVFNEHSDAVWSLSWAANAMRLASGSDDGTVNIYTTPV
eukprot:TRINITY_DN335_c0_g1_i1.p1 TRINITY_DN335_c0_g1~~TRINITY_DN335_c0_g1_i1.p1  ORF type:complete len:311 (-),score=62.19 TRINITY_DN335_c0_g1_i1:26-922(-)